jgi:drug/metabolite transporter (DMT)-like permease
MAVVELAAGLAFLAALCIGLSTVAVGLGLGRVRADHDGSPVFAAAFVTLLVSLVVFWVAALLRGIPVSTLTPTALAPFVLAGVLYPALFRLLYYTGIDRIGANVTGAVVAGNPAVAGLLAIAFLGERFTAATAVGLVAIVGGAGLLQLAEGADADADGETTDADGGTTDADGGTTDADGGTTGGQGPSTDVIVRELAGSATRDLLYPVGAMVAVGVGYVLISFGLDGFPDSVTATAVTQTAGVLALLLVLLRSGDARRQVGVVTGHRAGLAFFVAAGAVVAVGWLGQFAALGLGSVVVVVPLVNTYPLVIAAVSYAMARQLPRSPRVVAGIVAIVVGASLMQAL